MIQAYTLTVTATDTATSQAGSLSAQFAVAQPDVQVSGVFQLGYDRSA